MSRPYTNPARRTLLAAVLGREDIPVNVPRWMDRQFGYTAKRPKNGNTKKQKSEKR